MIDAEGKYRGGVRALIVPDRVVKQATKPLASTLQSIKKLKEKLEASGLLFGAEKVRDYVARHRLQPGLRETPHGDRRGVVVPFTSSRIAERSIRPQCLRLFQRAQ